MNSSTEEKAQLISPGWSFWTLAALSTSIGWGIRGNFGHEAGAMIAGVLGALAVVILSGREDWIRRAPWFAALGGIGWSFGGSMSYGQVIAYTHSGHSASVLYGFASLFLIGFLWAALGGAGIALAAFLTKRQLSELIPPLTVIFCLWYLRDQYEVRVIAVDPAYRQNDPLYWFDTDWTAALLAVVGVLVYAGVRRRWDKACSLILHVAVGWWAAFLILVVLLGIRMTPPRGDSWAGCLGMVIGLWVFLQRNGLAGVTLASLVAGFIGGLGFSGAILLKLIEVTSGLETNWHSIMEQTYGAVNGIAIAAAMGLLLRRAPSMHDESESGNAGTVAVVFTLLIVPYLNIQKNPERWVEKEVFPASMYGIPTQTWFDLGFAAAAIVVVWLIFRHRRNPIPLVPSSAAGKAQLLYIIFLWMMVIANFERAIVGFAPQRLITEGVIFLNAVLCSALVLGGPPVRGFGAESGAAYGVLLRRAAVVGMAALIAALFMQWGIVRAIYGNRFAGHGGHHVRFGPDATATAEKPKPGAPRP